MRSKHWEALWDLGAAYSDGETVALALNEGKTLCFMEIQHLNEAGSVLYAHGAFLANSRHYRHFSGYPSGGFERATESVYRAIHEAYSAEPVGCWPVVARRLFAAKYELHDCDWLRARVHDEAFIDSAGDLIDEDFGSRARAEKLREAESVTDGSRASTDYEARQCQHLSTLEACTSEGLQFVPLVVEACGGGWGPIALKTWRSLGEAISARTGEGSSVESQRLLQTLGIALQRENARAVLRRLDWWVHYPLFLLFWPRLSQAVLTPWFHFHLCFSCQQLERADWLAPSATLQDACGCFVSFLISSRGPACLLAFGSRMPPLRQLGLRGLHVHARALQPVLLRVFPSLRFPLLHWQCPVHLKSENDHSSRSQKIILQELLS